jgi:thiamine-phosphate pyrophosphorylase
MKGLYLVTPDWDDTTELLQVTELALRGGAALVQYRHKSAGLALLREQADALLDLCRSYSRPLIINDYLGLCQAVGADGLHVGDTDISIAKARAALGPDKIVGASCYDSLALAHEAWQAGASYVALGGFYPSRVKKYAMATPLDIVLQAKAEIPLPCVVIGGMTPGNAMPLVERGADMVAAVSAVYMAEDTRESARQFAWLYSEHAAPSLT